MSQSETVAVIFRRVGGVLLGAAAFYIVYMIWRLSSGGDYGYGMMVPLAIGGALLLRGSLRTAFHLSWIASLLLPIAVANCLMALQQPIDLTLTQIRLAPAATISLALPPLVFCLLLYWLVQQLGRPAVLAAMGVRGTRRSPAGLALVIGAVLALLAVGGKQLAQNSDLSHKAGRLAQEKHGAQFRYHVASVTPRDDMEGTFVEAKVLAWSAQRVDTVDVFWKEK